MQEKKNNQKQALGCDAAIMTAQFRFSLIAPLLQGLVPDESDTAYFMRITRETLTLQRTDHSSRKVHCLLI